MPDLSPTVLALISALLGGSGLKFVDYWLGRAKVKEDSAAAFRTELRDEVANLRTQITAAEIKAAAAESKEAEWREKYFEVMEELIKVKSQSALDIHEAQTKPRPRRKAEPQDMEIPHE